MKLRSDIISISTFYLYSFFLIFWLLHKFYIYIIVQHGYAETDFVCYLTGAYIIKEGNVSSIYDFYIQTVYQLRIMHPYFRDYLLPYRPLPLLAYFYVPFTYFDLKTGYLMFSSLNIFLFGISLYWIYKLIGFPINKTIIVFIISFFPVFISLYLGQISFVFLTLFVFIYKMLKEERYFWAGLLSGLLLFKFHYLIAIPFFLIISRFRFSFIKGAIISSYLILFLSYLLYGKTLFSDYAYFLYQTQNATYGSYYGSMYSLYSAFRAFTQSLSLSLVLNALFYIYSLVIFYTKSHESSLEISFSVSLVLMLLFAVNTLSYDLLYLLIPILVYYKRYQDSKFIYMELLILNLFIAFTMFGRSTTFVALYLFAILLYLLNAYIPKPRFFKNSFFTKR